MSKHQTVQEQFAIYFPESPEFERDLCESISPKSKCSGSKSCSATARPGEIFRLPDSVIAIEANE